MREAGFMYKCDLDRLSEKIKTFSKFGDTGNGGITRLSLSDEALAAREEFCKRLKKLGANIVTDDMANIYATIPGSENLPAILSGSHLDSVRQGGNYDGVLGVLSVMEAVETIVTDKIPYRHPITVVVWTNEEGARFEPAMMSSGVLCGKFKKEDMLNSEAKDIPGYYFKDALEKSGYKGSEENRMNPEKTAGLVELHAEQGPVLDAENKEVGIVEGVCGMVNYEFTMRGQADHAGTFPMKYRKDALYACAKVIDYLHENLDKLDEELVYTTGKISAHPNIHTIIPDEVKMTLDSRHKDPKVMEQVVEVIKNLPESLEKCTVEKKEAWARDTVYFDKKLVGFVEDSVKELGYTYKKMYSGAGHDAQYMCDVIPTTMIFVPSVEGHSHCELEYSTPENCLKGANVLLNTLLKMDEEL